MAMLEGDAGLSLDALNLATQAWVEQEYHRTHHSEINATPMAHYLAGPNVARPCPGSAVLAGSFCIEVARRQRRSDGTVSLAGTRFEIPARYRHLQQVNLRYARWDLSKVDLVDARTGAVLCAVKPLDKSANANGQRRLLSPAAVDLSPVAPTGMPALMTQLLADYAATGLPPAYLPVSEHGSGGGTQEVSA
jgi:putative transposase